MNIAIDENLPIVTLARMAHSLGYEFAQDGRGGLKLVKSCDHSALKFWSRDALRCGRCRRVLYRGLPQELQEALRG